MIWLRRSRDLPIDVIDRQLLAAVGQPGDVLSQLGHLKSCLRTSEWARFTALRYEDQRAAFLAAHLLVRACVSDLIGIPADEFIVSQVCDICRGDHGRPRVEVKGAAIDIGVSWSHARRHVLAAASFGPVGVDIEDGDADVPRTRRVFSEGELHELIRSKTPAREALRLWTRKEALAKLGLVELDAFGAIDVRPARPVLETVGGLSLKTFDDDGWVASLACSDIGGACAAGQTALG